MTLRSTHDDLKKLKILSFSFILTTKCENKNCKSKQYLSCDCKLPILKKDLTKVGKWSLFNFDNCPINDSHNALVIITGTSNIIVVDIDNINHWQQFLKEHNITEEPNTVKVKTSNG